MAGAAAGVALPLGEPFKLDQDALRERLKEMGCFTLKTSGGIADRDRKNLFTMLRRLGRKGAIRFEGKQVWIIE